MTMLEIVFAMSVILACALVYAAAFPTSTTNRQKTDNHAVALTLADREMEALRDAGYSIANSYGGLQSANLINSTPASSPYSISNVTHGSSQTIANTLPSGTGTLTVVPQGTGVLRVTVVVSWVEKSATRSISLSSYLANVQ
ncbi:MAG: hypothetical protein IT209_00040 [Armatimonadetes bacterium]|nr:hypothetical protein [Armatimonadota bacterium]